MLKPQIVEPAAVESPLRRLPAFWRVVIRVFVVAAILLSLNQLFNFNFAGRFVLLDNQYQFVLVALLLPFAFVMWPGRKGSGDGRVPPHDIALGLLAMAAAAYLTMRGRDVVDGGWEYAIPGDEWPVLATCYLLWVLLIEALRRVGGWTITIIVALFSIYPVFASLAPGPFFAAAVQLQDVAAYHALSTESIFGIPMRAFATLVIGFLLFGAALQHTGAGEFFINMSFALFGGVRGGAAKVAIFASGLLGSMSGSVVTNVLTTGSMTIPAMKRTGFRPAFAGGVETCASTGGVLMPPVMGATAFVMATFLNVPYIEVCIAAAVPSLLYYFGLFMQIDAYAARNGMTGLPRAELPSAWTTFKRGWHYITVFVLLIFMLLYLKQEVLAPFYATGLLLVVNQIMPHARWGWPELLRFLDGVGRIFVEIAVLLLGVGMIVGALSMTGVIGSFANGLLYLAGNQPLVLLAMGAITSFILGMGMTVTACYIFLAVLLAPALVKIGLEPMAVHLFIMYWGMLSFITPPVALGAFAAASLAGSDPMRTGFEAMRLGSIIYIIPFFFVLNPALILVGSTFDVIEVTISAFVGTALIAAALQGYVIGIGRIDTKWPLRWPVLALMVIAGLSFAAPGGAHIGLSNIEFALTGFALAVPALFLVWRANRR
ncbi:MAG: TRAP transporter permease [Alphaproteobacteria bacterium]|nr:TRAP transporter permease [Alphaproteobacteria bacterium]